MDQSEALATAETALRSIVRTLLGPEWQSRLSQRDLESAEARRAEEPKVRPGALETDELLSYIDTSILTRLITDNWEKFRPVFGNLKRSKVAFEALNVYRRRVAHHRPLLAFERDLLSGISGQIRNQVAIYRQRQDPAPQFYAQIESALDQEGRAGVPPRSIPPFEGGVWPLIRMGETLTFTANGVDPRGRSLEWALSASSSPFNYVCNYHREDVGDSVTMTWTPQEWDFSATKYIFLSVRNTSSFHKDGTSDDVVAWRYTFEPPH